MRKKDNKLSNGAKTSKGGYIFLGIIAIFVATILISEQSRKFNEKKAFKYGVENICTIVELNRNKTQFVKYSYNVDGKTYFSQRATPFSDIYPGEMFKVKYLIDKPSVNTILFEYPVIEGKEQSGTKGYIQKITNLNEAVFLYKFKDVLYERRQLLREGHTFKQGDSVNIVLITTNPKGGIINY